MRFTTENALETGADSRESDSMRCMCPKGHGKPDWLLAGCRTRSLAPFCGIMADMTSAVPPLSASPSTAAPACARCLALAADPRRREPPSCLALRNTAPLVSQSEAGVPFSMLTFCCRDCGTVWRLYDRANELFVSWVPEHPLVR